MISLPSAGIGLCRFLGAARPKGGEEHGDGTGPFGLHRV
jgi:hypothetical protein